MPEPSEKYAVRLLTAALLSLSLMLTACGQSGALYFAKPEKDVPAKRTDKDSNENSDATTGP